MNTLFKITNQNGTFHMTCPVENAQKMRDLIAEYNESVGNEIEIKYWEAGRVPFEELPESVRNEALDVLKAFSEVNVVYENQEFHVSTAICISAHYAFDHCVCGYYKASDLYTLEERRQNFKESFGYAPHF